MSDFRDFNKGFVYNVPPPVNFILMEIKLKLCS